MAKKTIVFFTVGYPYGRGDEFLECEMKCAESRFERILIVSCDKKSGKITQYVPPNASLLNIRDSLTSIQLILLRIRSLLSLSSWKQILVCLKENGIKELYNGTKAVVFEKSLIILLVKNEKLWAGKYDFYYSYWLSGSAAYIALRKEKLGGVIFSRAHGYDCFANRGFHPFRREQFNNIDFIYPISNAGKIDLIAQGCDSRKIKVERLGVEKNDNISNPYKSNEIKRIVTCSNIVYLKRLDLLIDALSLINDIEIEWVHFGDGILKEKIEVLAKQKLDNKSNIKFVFMGRVPLKQIYEYYASVSISCFINCSDYEGIPVSVMEAMSYSIPCIARAVGGNSEIIDNFNNGILLSGKCTAQDLYKSIVELLNMRNEEYISMRNNAYKKYIECYDANKNYTHFWNEILNK